MKKAMNFYDWKKQISTTIEIWQNVSVPLLLLERVKKENYIFVSNDKCCNQEVLFFFLGTPYF